MTLRQCLREPIPEIEIAAFRIRDAVSAHLRGERDEAEELLRLANDKAIGDWLESLWDGRTVYNRPRRIMNDRPVLPKDQRAKPRYATDETKRLIHRRDGYYCRFCKIPVIRAKVRKAICEEYPRVVHWGNANASPHAAFQSMWAQYDHILPHSRGGGSGLENVFLTCAACNFGRDRYLLEELDLVHPELHGPRQGNWDGMEGFLPAARLAAPIAQLPRENSPRITSAADRAATQEAWFQAFDRIEPGLSTRMLAFLACCAPVGISWGLKEVLIVRLTVGGIAYQVCGIEPDGRVYIPWAIKDQKGPVRHFVEKIAAAIPNARAWETLKLWVAEKTDRTLLDVRELLAIPEVLRAAFGEFAFRVRTQGAPPRAFAKHAGDPTATAGV